MYDTVCTHVLLDSVRFCVRFEYDFVYGLDTIRFEYGFVYSLNSLRFCVLYGLVSLRFGYGTVWVG